MRRQATETRSVRLCIAVFSCCAVLVVALGACSSSDTPALDVVAVPAAVTVTAQNVGDLGTVLTSDGRPLYVFSPDHRAVVTCTGACAGTWPPLRVTGSSTAGAGVAAADLGSVTATGLSGRVVTFRGWPLYYYAGDVATGSASSAPPAALGQALFLNGGPWYTIRPDGEIVTIGAEHP